MKNDFSAIHSRQKGGRKLSGKDFYSDMMLPYALAYIERKEKYVQSLYIDTLIRESLLKEKQEKIKKQIDEAIDKGDRNRFFELVKELKLVEDELNA